jgi:nucleoid-associated protein YgaU
MRSLPLLLLVTAAALTAWWLLSPSEPTPDVGGGGEAPEAQAPVAPRAATAPSEGPGLSRAPAAPPRKVRPTPGRPRGIGALRVRLTAGERTPEASRVRLRLEALVGTPESPRLPLAQEDGTWLYESLPAGRYRVDAMVAGFVTASLETSVEGDDETILEVPLRPGSEIAWKAVFPTPDAPDTIQVLLFDGRGERIGATFQTSVTTLHVPGTRTVAMPLEGRIVGVKPGRYRVRGVSPAGESDEHEVDVRLGEPASVELRIRR